MGLAEARLLSSKKLPSVALELIVLKAYATASQTGSSGCVRCKLYGSEKEARLSYNRTCSTRLDREGYHVRHLYCCRVYCVHSTRDL